MSTASSLAGQDLPSFSLSLFPSPRLILLLKISCWKEWAELFCYIQEFLVDSLWLCRPTIPGAVISNDFTSLVFRMFGFFIPLDMSPPNNLEFVAGPYLVAGIHRCSPHTSSRNTMLMWHIIYQGKRRSFLICSSILFQDWMPCFIRHIFCSSQDDSSLWSNCRVSPESRLLLSALLARMSFSAHCVLLLHSSVRFRFIISFFKNMFNLFIHPTDSPCWALGQTQGHVGARPRKGTGLGRKCPGTAIHASWPTCPLHFVFFLQWGWAPF